MRMDDTDEEVDLRPRRPTEDRRYGAPACSVAGLRLVRLTRALGTLPLEEAVLMRGRCALTRRAGRLAWLETLVRRLGVPCGPTDDRRRSRRLPCDRAAGPLGVGVMGEFFASFDDFGRRIVPSLKSSSWDGTFPRTSRTRRGILSSIFANASLDLRNTVSLRMSAEVFMS